ncbi:hypothetical protein ANCCEY_05640 [Ancylostoma ceylanicum]|uniref:Uncharacterized protein n=1 Tax=Ancylostoma ceylanicum TaxID=53326 RepID=A0A0D6LYQ0_9BILA|nr:hypothetical protein ANCCEY_05640 [Ancylostoma ceylanicum]
MGEKADRTLTLLHLRKTFSEYMRIPLSGSRDVDPNRLLPLFTKVMAMFTPTELKAEFKEILNFTTFLCKQPVMALLKQPLALPITFNHPLHRKDGYC